MNKSGKKIQIRHNATEEVIYTFVIPVDTTDEQIQKAKDELDRMIEKYCDTHNDDCCELDYEHIIINAFTDSGIEVFPLVCDYTIYL